MPSFQQEIEHLKSTGMYRALQSSAGINFSSNDYLGLSEDHVIRSGLLQFLSNIDQLGSTGSRLLSGDSIQLRETEQYLARVFGSEACLIFGSGYLASLGVCTALDSDETEFFSDQLMHASWIDGMRLARGKTSIINHLDLQSLEIRLAQSKAKRKVILTESVFSMDGDCAPIESLLRLANNYEALLVIDEAHSTGVIGQRGLGSLSELMLTGAERSRLISVHTAGKSLGAYGAFVCVPRDFKELMINKSRSQIFSTALPPVSVEHIRLAVVRMLAAPEFVERLKINMAHLNRNLNFLNLPASPSPIFPILLGSNQRALKAANELQTMGLYVKAIRSPTVPIGRERLRVSISASHSLDDLNQLSSALKKIFGGREVESFHCRH